LEKNFPFYLTAKVKFLRSRAIFAGVSC